MSRCMISETAPFGPFHSPELYDNWRPIYRSWMDQILTWPAMTYAMNWESLPHPGDSLLMENQNWRTLPPGFSETYACLIDGVVRCKKCYEPRAVGQPETLQKHAIKRSCVASKKSGTIYVNSHIIRTLREKFSLKLSDLKRKLRKKMVQIVQIRPGTKAEEVNFLNLVQQILERRFYIGNTHPAIYRDLWPDEIHSVHILLNIKNTNYQGYSCNYVQKHHLENKAIVMNK